VSVIGYKIIKIKYLCANDGLSAPAVSTKGRRAMQGSELDGWSERDSSAEGGIIFVNFCIF
jgi:hypothetical protein